jgi:sirohydrochlorin cobaltochelatase
MGVHKGTPDLIETVDAIARKRPVVVVPLLMAAAYTLRAMRTRLEHAFPPGERPLLTRPIGTHPRFADLILNEGRLGCTRRGWQPDASGLLLVGHGTRRDPTSGRTTRRHAAMVMAAKAFQEVGIAFLDEPPSVPEAMARFATSNVVVVGLFLDRGEHGEEDIPELLQPFGPRTHYTGPVGLDPLVPALVLDQLRALAADAAA